MKVRSIRSKVLIAITGITLLTAAAMAFVFYGRSSRMIEENYITVLSQRTRLLTDTVDDMLKNVCNIDIKASCDKEIKEELEQYLNDKDEKRLNNISTRLRTFSKMDQAISSMYLVIPGESQFVTTLDYPVYRSGLKEDNLRQFETLCGKNGGPAIMDDLVHSKDKLLQFTEKVTGEDGQVIGYLCANIEEQNLRYDYLEDPSNQELGQIELIEDGRIIAAREQSRMGNKFPVKKYKNFISHSEVTGADKENIYIYCEGSFSGCGIFASVKRSAVLGDLAQMRKYVFGVAAVFGLIAMLAAIYISRIVYKPVRKLMTAMQSIADGEMDTGAAYSGRKEEKGCGTGGTAVSDHTAFYV